MAQQHWNRLITLQLLRSTRQQKTAERSAAGRPPLDWANDQTGASVEAQRPPSCSPYQLFSLVRGAPHQYTLLYHRVCKLSNCAPLPGACTPQRSDRGHCSTGSPPCQIRPRQGRWSRTKRRPTCSSRRPSSTPGCLDLCRVMGSAPATRRIGPAGPRFVSGGC